MLQSELTYSNTVKGRMQWALSEVTGAPNAVDRRSCSPGGGTSSNMIVLHGAGDEAGGAGILAPVVNVDGGQVAEHRG